MPSLALMCWTVDRSTSRFDPALGAKYVDMRRVLQALLIRLNSVGAASINQLIENRWRPLASSFENRMLDRLFR